MRGGWAARGTVAIRLGRPHFAFYRGYFDGLDIVGLAKRYVEPPSPHDGSQRSSTDLRVAKSMLGWIRGQLQRAAHRSGRPADARLLAIAPGVLHIGPEFPQSTLAQFQQEHDPDGLFSEHELLALFVEMQQDNCAPARRAIRNQRLRARQQHALARLEQHIGVDPTANDSIDMWIDPGLALHLSSAGISTLTQLLDFIDYHGFRWYRKVPGIGLQAAILITRWLQQDSIRAALDRSISAHALQAPRAFRKLIARPVKELPLVDPGHRIVDINGGLIRPAHPDFHVTGLAPPRPEDLALVDSWLATRTLSGHTARAYRRESERFLVWVTTECCASIQTLTACDGRRYADFLAMLGNSTAREWERMFACPQDLWLGERMPLHRAYQTRPFRAALKPASQRQALLIVRNFLEWLRRKNVNPDPCFETLVAGRPKESSPRQARVLERDELGLLLNCLSYRGQCNVEPQVSCKANPTMKNLSDARLVELRLRCILLLMGKGGLSVGEVSGLRRHQISATSNMAVPESCSELAISGLRNRRHTGVLGPACEAALIDYIAARGLLLDTMPARFPIISALGKEEGLSSQRLYAMVKRAFSDAARQMEAFAPATAMRLMQASPNWLRKMDTLKQSVEGDYSPGNNRLAAHR